MGLNAANWRGDCTRHGLPITSKQRSALIPGQHSLGADTYGPDPVTLGTAPGAIPAEPAVMPTVPVVIPVAGATTPGGLPTPGDAAKPGPPTLPSVLLPTDGILVLRPEVAPGEVAEKPDVLVPPNEGSIGLVGPVGVLPGPALLLTPYPNMPGSVTPVERPADPPPEVTP
jgi:hypothetical protein